MTAGELRALANLPTLAVGVAWNALDAAADQIDELDAELAGARAEIQDLRGRLDAAYRQGPN